MVYPNTNRLYIALAESNLENARGGTMLERIARLNAGIMTDDGGDGGMALVKDKVYVSNYGKGTLTVIQDGWEMKADLFI